MRPEADASKDYYAILLVPPMAATEDIKRSYRTLVIKYHPDKNHGNENATLTRFHSIQTAWDVLQSSTARRDYDKARADYMKTKSGPRTGINTSKSQTKSTPTSAGTETPNQKKKGSQSAGTKQASDKDSPRTKPSAPSSRAENAFWGSCKENTNCSTNTSYGRWNTTGTKSSTGTPTKGYSRSDWSAPGTSSASKAAATAATVNANANASRASKASPFLSKSKQSSTFANEFRRKSDASGQPKNMAQNIEKGDKASQGSPSWSDTAAFAKEWEKRPSAYATFHGPSSRYSPYVPDPSLPKAGLFGSTQPKKDDKKDTTEVNSGGAFVPADLSGPKEYDWFRSNTRYDNLGSTSSPFQAKFSFTSSKLYCDFAAGRDGEKPSVTNDGKPLFSFADALAEKQKEKHKQKTSRSKQNSRTFDWRRSEDLNSEKQYQQEDGSGSAQTTFPAFTFVSPEKWKTRNEKQFTGPDKPLKSPTLPFKFSTNPPDTKTETPSEGFAASTRAPNSKESAFTNSPSRMNVVNSTGSTKDPSPKSSFRFGNRHTSRESPLHLKMPDPFPQFSFKQVEGNTWTLPGKGAEKATLHSDDYTDVPPFVHSPLRKQTRNGLSWAEKLSTRTAGAVNMEMPFTFGNFDAESVWPASSSDNSSPCSTFLSGNNIDANRPNSGTSESKGTAKWSVGYHSEQWQKARHSSRKKGCFQNDLDYLPFLFGNLDFNSVHNDKPKREIISNKTPTNPTFPEEKSENHTNADGAGGNESKGRSTPNSDRDRLEVSSPNLSFKPPVRPYIVQLSVPDLDGADFELKFGQYTQYFEVARSTILNYNEGWHEYEKIAAIDPRGSDYTGSLAEAIEVKSLWLDMMRKHLDISSVYNTRKAAA